MLEHLDYVDLAVGTGSDDEARGGDGAGSGTDVTHDDRFTDRDTGRDVDDHGISRKSVVQPDECVACTWQLAQGARTVQLAGPANPRSPELAMLHGARRRHRLEPIEVEIVDPAVAPDLLVD
ncbi:MAG: hypothetical protein ACOYXM_14720 [Actinomycetota bacterium]